MQRGRERGEMIAVKEILHSDSPTCTRRDRFLVALTKRKAIRMEFNGTGIIVGVVVCQSV